MSYKGTRPRLARCELHWAVDTHAGTVCVDSSWALENTLVVNCPLLIIPGAPGVRGGQCPPEWVLTSRIHPTAQSWTWERETQTLEMDLRLL